MLDRFILEKVQNLSEQVRRLDKIGLERTREGYYYIAHYPPLKTMNYASSSEGAKLVESVDKREFETYLHIPYCEIICSFCHFDKELKGKNFDEKEAKLIDTEKKEMEYYRSLLGGKINAKSFYIGGGTPSALSTEGLVRLLEAVGDNLNIAADAEIKFELFPRSYDSRELSDKLKILKDFGFTDVVIDLESGNQRSLNAIGRKNSSLEAYQRLVDQCVASGFDSIVTALMMGLPYEDFNSLNSTLETLIKIPEVKIINTFPLITREPDQIVRQVRDRPEIFPDVETRDVMWMYAREFLKSHGFSEGPISYMNRDNKRPEQQADKFECANLLAFGPSGFGYMNGSDWAAQYFNFCNRREYYDNVNLDQSAIWKIGYLNQEERARRKLIFGLANCKYENLGDIEREFGISVDDVFGKTLNALESLELIDVSSKHNGIRYTQTGLCRVEEISYFLGSNEVNRNSHREISDKDPFKLDIMRRNYYINISAESESIFLDYVQDFPQKFMHKVKTR